MLRKRIDITPVLTKRTRTILTEFASSQTLKSRFIKRAAIILKSADGKQDIEIAKELGLHHNSVSNWRSRYLKKQSLLAELEVRDPKKLETTIKAILSDLPRSGKPPVFTADQITQIIELAHTDPKDHGYKKSRWSLSLLAREVVKSGIAERISDKSVGRFLNQVD